MSDAKDEFVFCRLKRSFFLALICVLIIATGGYSQTASSNEQPYLIAPGETVTRKTVGGQRNGFRIDCKQNNFIKLSIDQQGIDVGARFLGPQNNPVLDFDSDPRNVGEEAVEFVCASSDPVVFSVDARQRGTAAGTFMLTFREVRPATDKDRALDEARRLLVSATQLWRAAKYSEAMPVAMRCLEIRERELGPDHPDVGLALFTVGNIYSDIPNLQKAEEYYRRAIVNRSKALGSDHVSLASIFNNYGLVYKDMARYPEALALFDRALEIRERALSPDHLLVASVLNNIALVLRLRGDIERAQNLYTRVLSIREKALGPDHPDVATAINNVVDQTWELERAEPMYLRALAIREAKLPQNHPDIGQSLYNLALLYSSAGQFDKAEKYCLRSLESFKASLGPEHPFVTLPMNLLALVAKGKGDFQEAERLFEETIALKEKVEGPFHPYLGGTLANAANLYSILGKTDKALAALARSNEIFDYNLRLNMLSGSEAEKLRFIEMQSVASDLALTIALDPKRPEKSFAPLALASVLQRKGRVLDSMAESVAALRSRLNKEDSALLSQWNDTNSRIANLVVSGPDGESPQAFRKRLADMEAERDNIERKLSSQGASVVQDSAAVNLETIIKSLPSDAALIEFVVYRPVNRSRIEFAEGGPASEKVFQPPRYAALVLTPAGRVEGLDLGDSASIDGELQRFRTSLRVPRSTDVRATAILSGSRVFGPLLKVLGSAKHILISPDGELNLVPFEALADQQGKFLVERFAFTYLNSGRDLVRQEESRIASGEPLLVADPDFGSIKEGQPERTRSSQSITTARNLSDTYFAPLSGTEEEIKAIRSIFPTAKVLSKGLARESELRSVVSPRFLHIATHGFFVNDPVGLVGSGAADTRGTIPAIAKRNPLLRSGLALAGANSRVPGNDDGILTALEVTSLDLRGSQLVVLSACDTGVGVVKTGEGVFGLRRAFQLAGAEALVMSLWPVSDRVTKELMSDYYRNLKQGLGRGESLRRVQLQMLTNANRRHPFYWASFIQGGDWRPLELKP